MDDDWDDDYTPAKPMANTNKYNNNNVGTSKASVKNDEEWDDDAKPSKSASYGGNNKKNDDSDWADEKPVNNRSNGYAGGSNQKNDDDWDDQPSGNKPNNGKRSLSYNDDWNEEAPKTKSPRYGSWNGGSSNNTDGRGPRKPDWICSSCKAKVFGSKDTCFKCQAPKGDSKDAPPDSGNRGGRPNDWICSSCNAKVFGSRDSCFKCQAPKGDSKDAPPDSGNRGGRPNDWICSSCNAKVFGSKDTCFKCQAPKGDSKDAPPDSGSRGGRPNDWICSSCNAKVFGSKDTCFKCQAPKGDSKDAPSDDGGSSRQDDGPRGKKPGDWECTCGHNNFSSRDKCQKCNEAKPEGAGDTERPKEFYIPTEVEDTELFGTGISTGINFDKYSKIPVEVIDTARNSPPKPITSFDNSGLNELIRDNLKRSNYTNPTPIQRNAIPAILAGRDIMACAQTGSGKTAAFLLPIIQTLMAEECPLRIGRPYAVIVTPTRELTTQIYLQARKYAHGSVIKCCQVYFGTASRHQSSNLNNGCHILVATPGRLLDFCRRSYVTFDILRFLVLDEADRMLDMGFKGDIEAMMNNPTMVKTGKRQTLMFSATFPDEIRRLAGQYLSEHVFLKIGLVGGACSDVEQTIHSVGKYEKREKLKEILENEDGSGGTMVFVETKKTADFLASFLSEYNIKSTSIHGDRMQSQREDALRDFKTGRMKVLLATAVAARGLDIPNVKHVIDFDLPKTIDEYVHRIGRTGRVGNLGKSTSFFESEQDADIVHDLVRVLKDANQKVPDFLGSGGSASSNAANASNGNRSADPPAHGGGDDDEEW